MEEPHISQGFDRNIDYDTMKKKLIKKIDELVDIYTTKCKKTTLRKIIYCLIACISLRNGSRISESVVALEKFYGSGIKNPVIVRISKSDGLRRNKDGNMKKKPTRYRKIIYPKSWFCKLWPTIKNNDEIEFLISTGKLKKRVLDYMLLHFDCNTHSLRYAYINYMLYIKKIEMNIVSKIVGHVNCS